MSGFEFRVDADISSALRHLDTIKQSTLDRVTVQALNKTGATVQSRVVKKLSEATGAKKKVVRQKLTLRRATRGGAQRRRQMYAMVVMSRYATNLIDFVAPSKRRPGYFNARVKGNYRSPGVVASAWGKSKIYHGTFIGRNGKGQLRVYARIGHERDHLKLISGPSFQSVFNTAELHQFMRDVAAERFPVEFMRAANLALSKGQ